MSSNWPTVKTGDVFDLINGFAFKSKEFCGQGASVLKIKNVKAGYLALDNLAYVDPAYLSKKSDKVVQKNDLLITMSGNRHDGSMETWVGKVAWFNEDSPYLINQRVGILRLKDGLDINPRYMAYQLSSVEFQKHFIAVATSSGGQANLSPDQIKQTELNCPPREIQDEIVNQLGCLEDKAKINSETNQTLEQIAQALFKSWFVDFDPVKEKIAVLEAGGTAEEAELAAMSMIAAKSSEQLAELKQSKPDAYEQLAQTAALFPSAMQESELGDIPEGWDTPVIQDVATVIKGKSYKSSELSPSSTALVTLKSFNRGGGYRLDGLKEYTGKYKPEQEVFAGDLIIAYTDVTQAADVIGKPAMVISDARYQHLVISLDVAVVRSSNDNLKYYLYGVANTDSFQQHTQAHSTGTTVLHLSKNAVPGYRFVLANEELVNAYIEHAKPVFSKINETIEENNSLSALRDTLLPKLLAGEQALTVIDEA